MYIGILISCINCLNDDSFEGPEKKLDIRFYEINNFNVFNNHGNKGIDSNGELYDKVGLRNIDKTKWQTVLNEARVKIVSNKSNQFIDSYVLSESSLFVYPNRVMVKTCGTTTLLLLIDKMIQVAQENGLGIEMLIYSHKNLNQPAKQIYPQCSFIDEVNYLDNKFQGQEFIMGQINKEHWNLYIADFRNTKKLVQRTNQSFEIMMHDLDEGKMKQFYKQDGISSWNTTVNSGIVNLHRDSMIDDYQFDPYGYSMNALQGSSYWTIHITPQLSSSYVSFDSNVPLENYNHLLKMVLSVFKPGRFTIAIYSEYGAPCGDPYTAFNSKIPLYSLQNKSVHSFQGGYDIVVSNYQLENNYFKKDYLANSSIIPNLNRCNKQ